MTIERTAEGYRIQGSDRELEMLQEFIQAARNTPNSGKIWSEAFDEVSCAAGCSTEGERGSLTILIKEQTLGG